MYGDGIRITSRLFTVENWEKMGESLQWESRHRCSKRLTEVKGASRVEENSREDQVWVEASSKDWLWQRQLKRTRVKAKGSQTRIFCPH